MAWGSSSATWIGRLLAGAIAIAAVVALGIWFADGDVSPRERQPTGGGPRSYGDALQRLDAEIVGVRRLSRDRSDQWLMQERLANLLLRRARLKGSFTDYAEAHAMLDRAFASAPPGAGPHQTQMALAFSLHRLGQAERMIGAIRHYAVRPEQETIEEITLTEGDIAFYRGNYPRALAIYRSSDAGSEGCGAGLRMANLLSHQGQPDEALSLIDRCEASVRLPDPQFLADLALRRGTIELQRGSWQAASRQFDRAARLFPDWWLAEGMRAQMMALEGRHAEAVRGFQRILKANDVPEAMDALASIHRAAGSREPAASWAARAGRAWQERLALLPEPAYGHAAEHELAFGDPARALDLARRDFALRPYGQSATTLAWALLATGDPRRALAVLDRAIEGGWVSAESHLAREQALLLLGRSADAEVERGEALRINPRAADRAMALIWLGH